MASAPLRYRMNLWASLAICMMALLTFVVGVSIASWISDTGPPAAFIVPLLGFAAVAWYYLLFVGIVEVRLWPDDGRMEFRSFLRRRETNLSDVVSVDSPLGGMSWGTVRIRYRGSGYRRPAAWVGNEQATRDLVKRIQESNPTVDVKRQPFDPWRTTT